MNHLTTAFTALGGLGLFLLGMTIMTDGLRHLAGDSLRKSLTRFTKNPLTGTITGAISTAILQSSSATTVAAVGFVGVGLLKFSGALGIIFGANLGTTITGWFVALLGFKFKIGFLALPLIFVGASLKIFAKEKWSNIGYALAGFGLIFVGISTMQEGMSGFQGIITPENLPQDSFFGRIQLVLLGMIATVITQSSSAGVAAAMTALHMGNINFGQAMCLVIGMDIGTTITALMATIGGAASSRRTGFSHVLFNMMTGVMAFLLISPYQKLWEFFNPNGLVNNSEIALVGFHSFFNLFGLLAILPFTNLFADMMYKLVPEVKSKYTDQLDKSSLREPNVALDVTLLAIQEIWSDLLNIVKTMSETEDLDTKKLEELQTALNDTHSFADQIQLHSDNANGRKRLLAAIHSLDHLQRLHERCEEEPERAQAARDTKILSQEVEMLQKTIAGILMDLKNKKWTDSLKVSQECMLHLDIYGPRFRKEVMDQIADGKIDVPTATLQLEAIRWMRRVSRHIHQICKHLAGVSFN